MKRFFSQSQLRVAPDSNGRTLIGLAIPFNSLSRNLGGFVERFMPGSVTDTLKSGDVHAILNHDKRQNLGTQKAGTLRMTESSSGVEVEIDMPDTSYARDAMTLIDRGDGTGMSFEFRCGCVIGGRNADCQCRLVKENGTITHEVQRGKIIEVSVLTGPPPAYADTNIALRSLTEMGEADAIERYGINFEKLAGVFLSIKRGMPLSPEEMITMNEARALFLKVRKPALELADERAAALLID